MKRITPSNQLTAAPILATVRLFFKGCHGAKPMKWKQLMNQSKGVGRLSMLAGLVAGEICSLYAIFIGHIMNPVSYRFVENIPKLRTMYGRYQETYNLDGLVLTLVASFTVFAVVWCTVRGIAWRMDRQEARLSRETLLLPAYVSLDGRLASVRLVSATGTERI